MATTIKHLSSKDAIVQGLEALHGACDEDGFDFSNLDLSEMDAKDAKAVRTFCKTLKRGTDFNTAKEIFKNFCLGSTVVVKHTQPAVKTVPKDSKPVSKSAPKQGKSERVSKKVETAAVVDPIVHDGHGDVDVNMKKGTVELFSHPLMTFRHELLKRKECYEINFKWVTVKAHPLIDKVLVPHKSAPTEQALKLWVAKIARMLVLCYLSPYDTMPHPADSQGIINSDRSW